VTWLNVEGVNWVLAKGHEYFYHHRTVQRIEAVREKGARHVFKALEKKR
jgi:hypothetical protein